MRMFTRDMMPASSPDTRKRGQRLFGVALFLFFVLTACTQKTPFAIFETPQGEKKIRLELARTDHDRARGLMFRSRLDEDRGMLFLLDGPELPSFWMKNTYISLDLLFLSIDGVVVDLYERLPPCSLDPCPSYASCCPAAYALELKAGSVGKHLVRRGDRVRLFLGDDTSPACDHAW